MSGDSTPLPPHHHQQGGQGHISPPHDFESSPLYQTLNARLSRQESALSSLSAQVAQLSTLVKSSLATNTTTSPTRPKTTNPNPVSVFAPFDSELSLPGGGGGLPKSPFIPTSTPQAQGASTPGPSSSSTGANQDATISALTHQITALSTSVAQLQRLQQSQAQLTRQSSNPPPTLASLGGERHPGPLALGIPRPLHQGVESLINSSGPMTTPNASSNHLATPSGTQSPHSPFGPPGPGGVGAGRPGINRSFSSGVIGGGPGSGPAGLSGPSDTGFPPHRHGHAHTPSGLARDWPSPGPGQVGNERSGALTPGGSGVTAPGAGIVITKWDHLNLKVDLLRSISKYGIGPPNKIQTRVLPFMIKGSDIIAQAPPTTERIISYVIPALALCQTLPPPSGPYSGPAVIIVTTTVDQAMQCHKLVRGVGGPIGIRSGIAAGAAGSSGLQNEIANMQRDAVHILIGTPAKIAEVMTSRNGLGGGECRLLILDEVDQLIARNLYENVLNVAKLLPAPRRGNNNGGTLTPGGALAPFSPGLTSPYDAGRDSPFNPASKTPFPTSAPGSRFGGASTPIGNGSSAIANAQTGQNAGSGSGAIERQTCLFSNTIPTDVINFSQSLQVRDPVRVLVRREGGPNSQESVSSVTPGINLKHTYVYLTITGSAQSGNAPAQSNDAGPGTIGSGRTTGQASEEQTRAKEYKLDMLVKMLDDYPLWQAVIHVGTYSMLEAVVFKLQGRKWETLYLTPDMPPSQKKAVLQQWRTSLSGNGPRFLVVFDVNIKPPEVPWAPLVINFDLPRSVEGYAHRAAAAVPPTTRQGPQVNGVIVSFVQAAGGDVEMLRSTECAYRFKSAEIPTVFHDLFNH
ncbi:hypothetical protein IAT40_006731 [Kwoniella sp. CBS 6097]